MPKPKIVLHPGFPKCGSSAVQRMFVVESNRLGHALGVGVIGQNWLVNNGYPEVSKLMYSPEIYMEEMEALDYQEGIYFLSNEALQGNGKAIRAISKKFDIEAAVFTIRCPVIQAFSNYRYSGWLESNFTSAFVSSRWEPSSVAARMKQKIYAIGEYCSNLRICTLEGSSMPFEERFLRKGFGWAPSWLHDIIFTREERVNMSIGIAFSEACFIERELRNIELFGFERNGLVKAAQAYPLPERLARLTTVSAVEALNSVWRDGLQDYLEILRDFGVRGLEAREVLQAAEEDLGQLASRPVADAADMADLREHAACLMDRHLAMNCQH